MTMRLAVWEPFKDMMTLRRTMDRLFEESFVPMTRMGAEARVRRNGRLHIPVDAYETDNELVILTSLPGLKPEDVEITFEDGRLTIRGEIKSPGEDVNYVIRERAYGPFDRTLKFRVPVEADKIEATFNDGVLTLTVPKSEAARPKTIKVKAK